MNTQERFPTLYNAANKISKGYSERFAPLIQSLEDGVKNDGILNPVFEDAKHVIGRIIEKAWENVRYANEPQNRLDQPDHIRDFIWDISFINGGIAGFYRTTTKRLAKAPKDAVIQPLVTAAKEFLNEIKPIADAFEFFRDKTKIIKRKPKSEEEKKAAFAPPPATMESSRRVKALLERVIAEEYENLYVQILEKRRNEVEAYKRAYTNNDTGKAFRVYNYLNKYPYADSYTLQRVVTYTPNGDVVVDNFDDIIKTMSRRDADDIRDSYISKNLRKIVSVLEEKEKQGTSLVSADVVGRNISLGRFTGTFRVVFSDKSEFTFVNSVVYSHSIKGTLFMRFPLTFHDVLLPGGVKMSRPSEERMNTVFLGKTQNIS